MQNKSRKAAIRISSQNQDTIDETVDLIAAAPVVTLVVDVVALRSGLGSKAYNYLMAEGDLAYGSLRAASSLGRLAEAIVVVDGPVADSDIRLWRHHGIQAQWPTYNCPSQVLTTSLVMRSLLRSHRSNGIVLFVVGSDDYLDLMKEVQQQGHIVVSVLPNRGMVAGSRAVSDITLELENVLSLEDEGLNLDTYNFDSFIKLLARLEGNLPFVGVQYFIERQMTRLRVGSSKTRYKIFHKAKEMEIILIGSKPNKDSSAKDVSTCYLNKEHPLVSDVLAGLPGEYPNDDAEDDERDAE